MCYWQPQSSSWSAASFSSGSESDPPVAFIHQGLLCPGMSLTLSFSHNPHWSREVGCRGKFGTNPKGEYYPYNTQPPHPIATKTPPLSLLTILPPLTITHGQRRIHTTSNPSFPCKVKSCHCDLLFHKCLMRQAHELTSPTVCLWPQGQ